MESSKISIDPAFIKACEYAAGYYKDSNRSPSLKNTIMMAGINYSYRDFFHNFKCYTDMHGIKFLPISLDENIHNYLSKFTSTFLMPDLPGRGKVNSEASGFGGKNFNLIGCRKLEAVGGALRLGYDVVFSDVDIALLNDPIDYLFFPGIDYTHSENNGCLRKWKFNDTMEGNTGFYSVKSNPKTIRTWDLAYKACSVAPLYDDQTMFWLILRTNKNPEAFPLVNCPSKTHAAPLPINSTAAAAKKIVSCPLDNCMFSASNLREEHLFQKLVNALKTKKQPAIMAHANWMNGKDKKKAALIRTGLWITQRPSGTDDIDKNKNRNNKNFSKKDALINGNWTCSKPRGQLVSLH